MIDYQNYNGNKNLGLGIGFGIGLQFETDKFHFSVNPKLEKHLFLMDKQGLIEMNCMFSVGYKL
jgi:hypothetical protein